MQVSYFIVGLLGIGSILGLVAFSQQGELSKRIDALEKELKKSIKAKKSSTTKSKKKQAQEKN